MIEKWGSGTNKMIALCKENGLPAPYFKEHFNGISVTFKFKEPIGEKILAQDSALTNRQKEILYLLKKSQLNSAQIVAKLKNSPSRRAVQFDLTKLQKLGLIKREGESRAITWQLITSFKN